MTTLVIAEHDNNILKEATHKAVTAAQKLGGDIHLLIAGKEFEAVKSQACSLNGVSKVLVANDEKFSNQLAEAVCDLVLSISAQYKAFIAPATTTGKNLMPRLAALLDVMQVSDVISVESEDTFIRPIYAGNAIQKVQSTDEKKVITVRTSSFEACGTDGSAEVEEVSVDNVSALSKFTSEELAPSDLVELTSAKVIISVGRGIGSQENIDKVVKPLAEKLGAAIGASRAAVDSGYAPNDWQVGQTGKIVAPELYIAIGISGAIQHIAGMKESKVIVAINKDEEAPIFQLADYYLVGDLFDIVPKLNELV